MKTVWIIVCREFRSRVRRPSFWLLSFVIPLLVAGLYLLPPLLASRPVRQVRVAVVDESGIFATQLQSSDAAAYLPVGSVTYGRRMVDDGDADALLLILARETTIPTDAVLYYHAHSPSAPLQADIDHQLQTILRNSILLDVHGITVEEYALMERTRIRLRTQDMATGREAYAQVKSVLGLALALLALLSVVLFGGQVTHGVMEERHSRVVEMLLSSTRPFPLLAGKVLGIGMAGLLQFTLWLALSAAAIGGIRTAYADMFARVESRQLQSLATKGSEATAQFQAALQQQPVSELMQGLESIDWGPVVLCFFLFATAGYLLYAGLFAALGARLDKDADSSAFTLLLSAPLLTACCCIPALLSDPSGPLAVVLSLVPFTSPVALLFRLPFGVPVWQVVLSLALILLFVPLCTAWAAAVYRRRILKG
ncbi:MAG: ABC-type Na+ efflux pump permease component-like protein [bacterium P3]|nr:MAG: ABC-type Na+ efflux pump permease component-like protein [bacterium P3]KWW42466.1 MAG: ABC-type Na+ efflux pump permease component-like protein [bacterium F083]